MLTEVRIKDNTNAPYHYLSGLDAFQNGKTYKFKPGINIVIGKNGSGKSTLLNMIAEYAFCHKSMKSRCPSDTWDFPRIIDKKRECIKEGIEVALDYRGKVFRYMPSMDMNKGEINNGIDNFLTFANSQGCSVGEQSIVGMKSLFKVMFSEKDLQFPLKPIADKFGHGNDYWKAVVKSLVDYIQRNECSVTEEGYEYTVLVDEPDRNLDIENIEHVYNTLSYRKEMTQMIAVVHNPILIYKLSKKKYIHFIEMTDGYLNSVKKIFDD